MKGIALTIKKLIAFQRLVLNSRPSFLQPHQLMIGILIFIVTVSLYAVITDLDTVPIALAIISLMSLNLIFNNEQRLFKIAPVSRKFTALNLYLTAVIILTICFIMQWLISLSFVGIIIGLVFVLQGFGEPPSDFAPPEPIINILKGDMILLLVLIIILFAGTTIALIRNKMFRNGAYAGLFILTISALAFLKSFMPAPPSSGKLSFVESLSLMPQIDQILTGVAMATLVTIPLSMYIGYTLYTRRPNSWRPEQNLP